MTEPIPNPTIAASQPSWASRGPVVLRALVRGLIRLCILCAGFVLMLAALFVALMLVTLFVVWSLLRGRRPAAGVFRSAFERGRRRTAAAPGQVIDVEVREVPDPALPRRGP